MLRLGFVAQSHTPPRRVYIYHTDIHSPAKLKTQARKRCLARVSTRSSTAARIFLNDKKAASSGCVGEGIDRSAIGRADDARKAGKTWQAKARLLARCGCPAPRAAVGPAAGGADSAGRRSVARTPVDPRERVASGWRAGAELDRSCVGAHPNPQRVHVEAWW